MGCENVLFLPGHLQPIPGDGVPGWRRYDGATHQEGYTAGECAALH